MVNTVFCSGSKTKDGCTMIAASFAGNPFIPFTAEGVRDGGFSRLLFRPFGETGCRYGINEKGLFAALLEYPSKYMPEKDGMKGTDAAEAVLKNCSTPKEAVDEIQRLIGQGFDTEGIDLQCSFFVADASGGYIIETACDLWAADECGELAAFSADYTIKGEKYTCPLKALPVLQKKKGFTAFSGGGAQEAYNASRRFLALRETFELVNGQPKSGLLGLIMGEYREPQPPEGLDPFTLRRVLSAVNPAASNPIENMLIDCPSRSLLTSGALIYLPEDKLFYFTPSPLPHNSLFVPCTFKQGLELSENKTAFWSLAFEKLSMACRVGLLNPQIFMEQTASLQKLLDFPTPPENSLELLDKCVEELLSKVKEGFGEIEGKAMPKKLKSKGLPLSVLAKEMGFKL